MDGKRVIGVDLGGTKILAGVVGFEGHVEHRREHPTPVTSEDDLLAGLDEAVEELLDDEIAAIGFGLPSPIDQRTGRAQQAVNIPLDSSVDFRGRMAERFGRPVGIENDANAATYAEFHFGAGRDVDTMVMLTLGTGCGGGAVLDGRLYRGWAEFGHMVIVYDGLPCQGTCTGRGHLEPYVTGVAATKLAQEAFGPAVDAHRLVRLANEGERRAIEILDGIGRHLGAGIGSLVNIFNPELVVIGGGFAAAGDFILDPAREIVAREGLAGAGKHVRIVRAELGTAAGLIGAGLVAFDALG
ncbi:MAG TPA: ROK family protein [Gaiellaceae bacterium]|nr:ROK family protein [Gaiellaceae bacterium]